MEAKADKNKEKREEDNRYEDKIEDDTRVEERRNRR